MHQGFEGEKVFARRGKKLCASRGWSRLGARRAGSEGGLGARSGGGVGVALRLRRCRLVRPPTPTAHPPVTDPALDRAHPEPGVLRPDRGEKGGCWGGRTTWELGGGVLGCLLGRRETPLGLPAPPLGLGVPLAKWGGWTRGEQRLRLWVSLLVFFFWLFCFFFFFFWEFQGPLCLSSRMS